MNIKVNITETIKRVQEFKEYDLGQITTTLQNLLDNSSIIVDSNIIPILKVLTIDNIVKNYLIKDLTENIYNTGEYITGQDLTENDLLLITGESQGSGINTAFVEKTYAPTMSVVYDSTNPNFDITLTGNLDLTITETSNGDSGMVNLYFSATETATLNGFTDLVVTGDGEMIPVYFIHDSDGVKWYNNVMGGVVDTTTFAVKDGTSLYYTAPAVNTGTVSSSGTSWTTAGFSMLNKYLGAKLTVAGQTTIINSVDQDAGTFTTVDTIPATNAAFEIKSIAFKIFSNGACAMYDRKANSFVYVDPDGYIDIGGTVSIDTNKKVKVNSGEFEVNNGRIITNYFQNNNIYTFATLPTLVNSVTATASISDGVSPVYMTAAGGGGSTVCQVFWNGTLWLYH